MDPHMVARRGQDIQILDVREDEEWRAGRIEGAVHIPLGEMSARVGELDPDRLVVTVCRTRGRAGKAAEQLTQAGRAAEVMAGGMRDWERAQLPISTPDGRPGRVN